MAQSGPDLAQFMEAVARALLGAANERLSIRDKLLRFGANGSWSVDLAKGVAYSHELEQGGGVLWLVKQIKGLEGKAAFDFMRDELWLEVDDPDYRPASNGAAPARTNGHDAGQALAKSKREIEATYDYVDADGAAVFQVVRWVFRQADGSLELSKTGKPKKTFTQRRPFADEPDVWINGLDDGEYMRRGKKKDWFRYDKDKYKEWRCTETRTFPAAPDAILYRLPDLIEATAEGRTVYIVEGEKKADALAAWGMRATTNAGGAKKWRKEFAELFRGADVVMLPDNDPQATAPDGSLRFHPDGTPMFAGKDHVDQVGASLVGIADRVRVLELPGLGSKQDVVDWRDAGGTAEEFVQLVETTAKPWSAPARQARFGLVMWVDQENSGGDEYHYIIEDLIPQSEAVLIIGESQSGKSFLTTHMAMCGARGVPFFGRRVLEPFGVIYCAYEAGKGFRDRFRGYRHHFGISLGDLPIGVLTKPEDLWSNAVHTERLIEEILWIADQKFRGVKLGAVVIDTHNAATPGMNEVDGKETSIIRDRYRAIMRATGAGVWIIGHKNAAGKHRGNEQLYNNIETAIDISKKVKIVDRQPVLVRDADNRVIRTVRVIKQREGEDGSSWDFVLRSQEVGRIDRYGKPKTSAVVAQPAGEPADPGEAETVDKGAIPKGYFKLAPKAELAFRALNNVLNSDGVLAPPGLKCPPSTFCVPLDAWRNEFERVGRLPGDDEKQLRWRVQKAIARAVDMWLTRELIGKDGNWIWRTGRKVYGVDKPPAPAVRRPEEPPLPDDIMDFING